MKPRDRIKAVLEGKKPDILPILPVVDGYHAPKLIQMENWECFRDIEKMTKALCKATEIYAYDGVIFESPIQNKTKVLGCTIDLDGTDVPLFVDNLVKEKADIEKISIGEPMHPDIEGFLKGAIEEIKRNYFTLANVRMPFEIAYIVRGSINFLTDLKKDPIFTHELIDRCYQITLNQARKWIELGIDGIVFKESVGSSSLISPADYQKYAFPAEARVIKELKNESDICFILHICRNSLPIIKQMIETNADVLEVDSLVPLEKVFELVGDGVVIKGNIDSVEELERGNEEQLEERICQIVETVRRYNKEHRFILSTGDSVTKMTSPEIMKKMVELGRRLGRYGQ